MYNKDVKGN